MKRIFVPLRKKLLIIVLPLIIIPLVISITVASGMTMRRQEKQSRTYMKDILDQVSSNLDRYMRDLNSMSMMPLAEERILEIMRDRSGSSPHFITVEETLTVARFHGAMMYERSEIKGYMLFCLDGALFSNTERDVKNNWLAHEESWMDSAAYAAGRLVFLSYNTPAYYTSSHDKVISVARMILDPITFKSLGYVKIDMYLDGFRRILYPSDNELTRFLVYNDANNRVYPDSLENEAFILKGGLLELEGKYYLASGKTSPNSGFTIYLLYPNDVLQKDARDIQSVLIIISLAFLIVSVIVCILFSSQITKPLQTLYKDMLSFGKGHLSQRTHTQTNDEIGTLSTGFNKMTQQIQTLVRENFQVELQRREAEILLLQSQMNPHFLYNILETISMSAISNSDLQTSDIVAKLGKMLRYSVSVQKEMVKLTSEVQFCEDYLDLQIMRLGKRLQYEIYLNSELEDCLVPKLILQPFVENVVMHALGDKPICVKIISLVQWDCLVILIRDDGVGMTNEQQLRTEQKMYAQELASQGEIRDGIASGGIALRNVHQRIRILYGDSYGVTLFKTNKHETVFAISLPLMWNGDDE